MTTSNPIKSTQKANVPKDQAASSGTAVAIRSKDPNAFVAAAATSMAGHVKATSQSLEVQEEDEDQQQSASTNVAIATEVTAETATATETSTTRRRRKKIHPLQMPRRVSPVSGLVICRFYNYFENGCKRYNDPATTCPLDHLTCHICLRTNNDNDGGGDDYDDDNDDDNNDDDNQMDKANDINNNNNNFPEMKHHCRALDCPIYHDDDLFFNFQQRFTLKNTRPDDYPVTKTVLGHPVVWIETLGVPSIPSLFDENDNDDGDDDGDDNGNGNDDTHQTNNVATTNARHIFRPGHDDQLLRCRKLKRFEANVLSELAPNSRIVDVGGHFGDTTITLALYAKDIFSSSDDDGNNTKNFQFYCLEPNPGKCDWIRKVVIANDLTDTVNVLCVAVGDECRTVDPMIAGKDYVDDNDVDDDVENESNKKKTNKDIESVHRELFNGSLMYTSYANGSKKVPDSNNDTTISASVQDSDETKSMADAIKYNTTSNHYNNNKNGVPMITLDSIFDQLYPLGLLHIDVEGWESRVLQGAHRLLRESTSSSSDNSCYVIAEAWTEKECQRRGIISKQSTSSTTTSNPSSFFTNQNNNNDNNRNNNDDNKNNNNTKCDDDDDDEDDDDDIVNPEKEIVQIMDRYHGNFQRQNDIVDIERNIVYCYDTLKKRKVKRNER